MWDSLTGSEPSAVREGNRSEREIEKIVMKINKPEKTKNKVMIFISKFSMNTVEGGLIMREQERDCWVWDWAQPWVWGIREVSGGGVGEPWVLFWFFNCDSRWMLLLKSD